ncbi:dienelactone hydrolase family protein [Streptomyces himalayensis]|uniref:Alpha/beta fold hydrolase n=2 Tax=Streptomyces himalayensis TaxID=2820085 RepID=A0A7W2HGS2_9ACTN|nr:alpha/beta fold hydrolase [Streptomyces himalayensis]MBA2947524.1 alpha/beta fold hydrolase [Streptomyces himalayensis subsp. himalayensis]MBA4863206.1 alpha/beta fold hydrolase [Streptomyces himalayensis subsp. aureolus]
MLSTPVAVTSGDVSLAGDLTVPDEATGVVLFAHGSGSSRHSPRNQAVAATLREAGLGTLLFDLLTPDEEADDVITGIHRFDIALLGRRLTGAVDWLVARSSDLPLGLFGASTGAAAALATAAERPEHVRAVVSRGGRPDLAGDHVLEQVRAPVLLLVGGRDEVVLRLNQEAQAKLRAAPSQLEVIEGATHLFEEPGALDEVAVAAARWFSDHIGRSGGSGGHAIP